jgi:hypothetical protein
MKKKIKKLLPFGIGLPLGVLIGEGVMRGDPLLIICPIISGLFTMLFIIFVVRYSVADALEDGH